MAGFTGTNGRDVFTGNGEIDFFDMSQGGKDEVSGRGNDDTFDFGAELTARDTISGGEGVDLLSISGDYSAGVVFKANTMQGVEILSFVTGNSYDITLHDKNTVGLFTISGGTLGAGDSLTLDASADTDTNIIVNGGAGDDDITTGGGNDSILLGSGDDIAHGGKGVDSFQLGGFLDENDFIDGGKDVDFLTLVGDYSGFTFTKDIIDSIEVIFLAGAFDYDLSFANHASDTNIGINANGLDAGFKVVIDAHAEQIGTFSFLDSLGNDTFTGGHGGDFCNLANGAGKETIKLGDGEDSVTFGAAFTASDKIDGGDGEDTVDLNGDYSAGVTFKSGTVKNVETINLLTGHDYNLTLHDGTIAAGLQISIRAGELVAGDVLTLDDTLELDGKLILEGGDGGNFADGGAFDDSLSGGEAHDDLAGNAGNDLVLGGGGDDTLDGGIGLDILYGLAGADTIDGGANADVFIYGTVSESTGAAHDTIVTFNFNIDRIDLQDAVGATEAAINAGTLTGATFDTDLAAAVNSGNLHATNAVLFTPDMGDLAGHLFLVIERGGGGGYQSGQDIVVEIDVASNLGSFSTDNFA